MFSLTNHIIAHYDNPIDYHKHFPAGKYETKPTKPLKNIRDLSLAYTPGVAQPCLEIKRNEAWVDLYTNKANTVAVITNGTAVLGLGNIGPSASKPVMEGKAVLFKVFGNINSVDIEVDTENIVEFVNAIKLLGKSWGGVNLEDISAPDCFLIESRLQHLMDIPVFHDDQHGTSVVVLAGLMNALYITDRDPKNTTVVICGAGAAGIACGELLIEYGIEKNNILMVDRKGVLNQNRTDYLHMWKENFRRETESDTLEEAVANADVFIGVSGADVLTSDMLLSMNKNPIVFALSNPDPEINPMIAKATRKDVLLATGRTDFPNQINNVLCFPFLFRGVLDVKAYSINTAMKIAAAKSIAQLARNSPDFGEEAFIPSIFDERLLIEVPYVVAEAAILSNNTKKTCNFLKNYKQYLQTMRTNL